MVPTSTIRSPLTYGSTDLSCSIVAHSLLTALQPGKEKSRKAPGKRRPAAEAKAPGLKNPVSMPCAGEQVGSPFSRRSRHLGRHRECPGEPNVFYFGAGFRRSLEIPDTGVSWQPLVLTASRFRLHSAAFAVSASDHNIIYVGIGARALYSAATSPTVDGVYKIA